MTLNPYDLGVVSTPRISKGPAGCRINRDFARRGWATKTSHPNWGPGTRGLERADKHCRQSLGKQREPSGAQHAKDQRMGGMECAPGLVL